MPVNTGIASQSERVLLDTKKLSNDINPWKNGHRQIC